MEEATQANRFRSILASSLDSVITIDASDRVIDWNRQAERTFGWTEQEAAGCQLSELIIPPRYREAHKAGLRRCRESGEGSVLRRRLEITAIRKDGAEFPVELSLTAVPLDDSLLFTAFLRDVSERASDSEYRARMAALVDSSYDAIIGKDVAGTITSWNQGAERVYGYSEEEAVGQTIKLLLPADSDAEEPEILHAMQTGQRLEQFETERRRKDQSVVPVSLTVSPIADANGRIIGSSTVERDITESKRQKEELRQAKEDAEEASRTRAEFLANVSHELRTPMNAIIGMTQLALGEQLTDDIRDYVQTANESAHSLLTLLNDILDFSKLESGKFTVEKEPFDLRETIDETVKTLSGRAFEKGLELICHIPPSIPEVVVGDATRLRQVLTNLIGNAIKFTDSGEVVVSVVDRSLGPAGRCLQFTVRDTGIGISADDQRRILEPFTQVDASSTRRYGGTGLGLAICTELLQLMGSRLSVESVVGQGSRFSFDVSLEHQAGSRATHPFANSVERLSDIPVLIVDDNATNCRVLAETLAAWKMRPQTAADASQALEMADAARDAGTPFPLIIVDALMPETDGYALSRRMAKQIPEAPQIILMVASSDRSEFKQREPSAGISVYLQKPIAQSELLVAVMTAMDVQLGSANDVQQSPATTLAATRSVLLVEDTPANQKLVTSVLEKRGHQVTIAHNGREAVELFGRRAYDLVLMDIQMPIMDGFQATAAIREHEKALDQTTPIVAMTAHAMRGDRERCIEAGMDAYIPKPIDVQQLIELVETVSVKPKVTEPDPSVPGSSASQVFDVESTMRRLAGDKELFREFVDYFHEDSPKLLTALRGSLTIDDAAAVQRAAHSLKGLAANFGAQRCAEAALQLEEAGAAGDLQKAGRLFSQLEGEVARLVEALAEYRA